MVHHWLTRSEESVVIGLGILSGAMLVDKLVYGKRFVADPRYRRTHTPMYTARGSNFSFFRRVIGYTKALFSGMLE